MKPATADFTFLMPSAKMNVAMLAKAKSAIEKVYAESGKWSPKKPLEFSVRLGVRLGLKL